MALYYARRTDMNDNFENENWRNISWHEAMKLVTESGDTSFGHNVFNFWFDAVSSLYYRPETVVVCDYRHLLQWNPKPEKDFLGCIRIDDYDNGLGEWGNLDWEYISNIPFTLGRYASYGYSNYVDYIKRFPGQLLDCVISGYYVLYEPG